ncbi:hypothetical protein SMACR_07487 [Sordaria macrospora]|uniref:WGS project CABT00000000 data, contig 2.46 n=2 Tax=Sordaria macrospora TaxID=5147 RepID=F7W8R5_SORMK|nr:uncharacterized protein SMAC_07487 [Sordaria macrospora k-hell]KAA8632552.1 hypothetical protein SMACR_07487 [Sordaria macrospora]WPJ65459.1 hypothetical protein SMAC4_07487 [Sordaria macrospora]CCC13851.1 unnamed protein product [Sordaria macrospora k-hell]
MANSASIREKPSGARDVSARFPVGFPDNVVHASRRLFQLRKDQDEERLARVRSAANTATHSEQSQVFQDITNAEPMPENTVALTGSAVGSENLPLGNGQGKKPKRLTVRLPDPHVCHAMLFIPVEQLMEEMVVENNGEIPTKEDIENEATYFFVDACQEYPASLIQFTAKVLVDYFEPILERTTPTYKVYEALKAKTQFVKAMTTHRAGMFPRLFSRRL